MSSRENKPRTRPTSSNEPHNDLRVIWDAEGKRIISDHRPKKFTVQVKKR